MYEEKQHKKRPRRATTDLLRLAHAQPPRVEPVWIRLDREALGGEEGLVDLVNVLDERQYLAELVERLGLGLGLGLGLEVGLGLGLGVGVGVGVGLGLGLGLPPPRWPRVPS